MIRCNPLALGFCAPGQPLVAQLAVFTCGRWAGNASRQWAPYNEHLVRTAGLANLLAAAYALAAQPAAAPAADCRQQEAAAASQNGQQQAAAAAGRWRHSTETQEALVSLLGFIDRTAHMAAASIADKPDVRLSAAPFNGAAVGLWVALAAACQRKGGLAPHLAGEVVGLAGRAAAQAAKGVFDVGIVASLHAARPAVAAAAASAAAATPAAAAAAASTSATSPAIDGSHADAALGSLAEALTAAATLSHRSMPGTPPAMLGQPAGSAEPGVRLPHLEVLLSAAQLACAAAPLLRIVTSAAAIDAWSGGVGRALAAVGAWLGEAEGAAAAPLQQPGLLFGAQSGTLRDQLLATADALAAAAADAVKRRIALGEGGDSLAALEALAAAWLYGSLPWSLK